MSFPSHVDFYINLVVSSSLSRRKEFPLFFLLFGSYVIWIATRGWAISDISIVELRHLHSLYFTSFLLKELRIAREPFFHHIRLILFPTLFTTALIRTTDSKNIALFSGHTKSTQNGTKQLLQLRSKQLSPAPTTYPVS